MTRMASDAFYRQRRRRQRAIAAGYIACAVLTLGLTFTTGLMVGWITCGPAWPLMTGG